jgi:hypothetical protein
VADNLIRLAERQLRDGGTRGRLYVEGLASALVVHLLQTYGGEKPAERHAGGWRRLNCGGSPPMSPHILRTNWR